MADDRSEMEAARAAGLKARHETREARAVRKATAEEIALAADEIAEGCSEAAKIQRDLSIEKGGSTNPKGLSHMRTALAFQNQAAGAWAVAEAAREIGSRDPATSEAKP